jgi:hypothetical protein
VDQTVAQSEPGSFVCSHASASKVTAYERMNSVFVQFPTPPAEPADRVIELVLNQRRVLRVRPGFDADALIQLVRFIRVCTDLQANRQAYCPACVSGSPVRADRTRLRVVE